MADIKLSVIEEQNQGKPSANISWSALDLGENYFIQQFHYTVSVVRSFPRSNNQVAHDTIKEPGSHPQSITVQNVEYGKEYEVTVQTHFIDLDQPSTMRNVSVTKKFDIGKSDIASIQFASNIKWTNVKQEKLTMIFRW